MKQLRCYFNCCSWKSLKTGASEIYEPSVIAALLNDVLATAGGGGSKVMAGKLQPVTVYTSAIICNIL